MVKARLGDVLLSQDPAVQVPLALEGLTVVFGMGTRGTPPPSLPDQPCDEVVTIRMAAGNVVKQRVADVRCVTRLAP
jgi:hypothetical protein